MIIVLILAVCSMGSVAAQQMSRAERVQARVVEQEMQRLDAAKRRKSGQVAQHIHHARRHAQVLARTAAIEAWQERAGQEHERDISFGKYAHLYPVPAWPHALRFFNSTYQASSEYSLSRANRCFTSSGSLVDIAHLALGEAPQMKDLLLASSLALESDATPAAGHEFLADLARTPLIFSAAHVTRQLDLNYAISLRDNSLTFGVRVPLVEKMRHMRVWPDVDDASRSLLRDRTVDEDTGVVRNNVFRELYGINVNTYIQDVLEQKGMRFEPHMHQFSVGDVELFGTATIFSLWVERWQVGGQVTLPVAKQTDERFFYPLELGNGGFLSGKAFLGVLSKKTMIGHLHGMASVTVAFPATVTRRVPRQVTLSNVSVLPDTEIFGQELTFGAVRNINEPETPIAAFAEQTTSVTMRPGTAMDLRAGCIIMPFVQHALQADLYYHFHAQAADELHKNMPVELWFSDALTRHGVRTQHQVGTQLTYQPNAQMNWRLGLCGTLGGTNAPMTWTGTASLSYEW